MNAIFSFALRGAGDTRFVSAVSVALAWPVMVAPAWAAWYFGWGLYWAFGFASAYVIALGLMFLARFRQGKWKTMRVIEAAGRAEQGEGLAAGAEPEGTPVEPPTPGAEPCLVPSPNEA
jgi:MATE family multidrug resistance protein